MRMKKKVCIKYSGKRLKYTEEFIEAVKNLLIAEIKMMRKNRPEYADAWDIGVADIEDLEHAGAIMLMYGGIEDKRWLKKEGRIFVEVPKE